MRYRIVKDGEEFIPERKILFWWRCFWYTGIDQTGGYDEYHRFYDLASAIDFINSYKKSTAKPEVVWSSE